MILRIGIFVATLLASVVVHEAMHIVAMRGDGVRVVAAGLGLPFRPTIGARWRGITWTLSPYLLAAYVQADDDYAHRAQSMSHRARSWHDNAGIIGNLVLGFAAWTLAAATASRAALMASAAVGCWLLRRQIAAYLLPALAPVALAVLGYAIVSAVATRGADKPRLRRDG